MYEEIEKKLEKADLGKVDLNTALLIGIYRNFVPAPSEETEKELSKEEVEENELRQELSVKSNTLKNHRARLDGGVINLGGKQMQVLSCDVELQRIEREIKLKEIERQLFIPLQPEWRFQADDQWRELQKSMIKEDLDEKTKIKKQVEYQKKQIESEIPKLEERIEEIKKELAGKEDAKPKKEVKVKPVIKDTEQE